MLPRPPRATVFAPPRARRRPRPRSRRHRPLGRARRRLLRYANGAWLKTTEIPADRELWGIGGDPRRADRAARRPSSSRRRPKAHAPAGSDARKIGDYYASFMDEAAIEAKGLAPLQPSSTASRRSRTRRRSRALSADAARRRRRAEQRRTSTPTTCSASGSRRTSTTRRSTRRSCCRAASGMPDRDYYLDASPRMAEIRTQYQAHVAAHARARRHRRRRRRRPARIFELEKKIAAGAREPRRLGGRRQGQQPLDARRISPARARARLDGVLRGRGARRQPTFVVWQPSAVTGIAALVAIRAARDLEGLPDLPRDRARRDRSCRRRSSTSPSRSTARRSRARRSCATAGSAPSSATNDALGEAVGQLYVAKYFPPPRRRAPRRW